MDEEDGALLEKESAEDGPTEEGLAEEESVENEPAKDGLSEDRQQP
jgi:hypothetical protein